MTITLQPGFVRGCGRLAVEQQAEVLPLLLRLQTALTDPGKSKGLGLRKIHASGLWEVRIGISLRAVFELRKREAVFILLGTHDDVSRFLGSR